MGKNFLGLDGLKHFWSKAKSWIINRITTEVTAKIAEVVAKAPEDLDTLKEIADWISAHANDAAAMNTAISTNTSDIATLKTSVAGKSDTGHTHTKSEITDFPTSLPANGGTATKATQDGNGNNIANTYMPKSGGTFSGPINCNGGIHVGNIYPSNSVGTAIIFSENENDDGHDIILSSPNGIVNIPSTITPRLGTDNGATVSIGRSDGKITIGDINNKNRGFTTINNDCKILKALFVSGNGDMPSNFEGGCNFERDISVHSKSLFPSGYIPRTYFIERATKDNITAEQKELLRKMFAYQSVNRLIQCYGLLSYRVNTSEKYFGGRVVTVGYFDGDDWLDSNENINYDDNSCVNYACFGIQEDDENIYFCDMYNISEQVMRNKFENLNYLLVNRLFFTVLEKK